MENRLINPDIEFIQRIKKESQSDLKTCMQCGTCSVVCKLSPEKDPFPRKEMIWTAWGLKDKITGNPDLWLCHQCGECSADCPRGVNPADVMASLRNEAYRTYTKPGFLVSVFQRPAYLPLLVLFPVIIIGAILYFNGTFFQIFEKAEGTINYALFFPHILLDISFTLLFLIALFIGFRGIKRFRNDLRKKHPGDFNIGVLPALLKVKMDFLTHRSFRKCGSSGLKTTGHFMVLWGFILLIVVTGIAILNVMMKNYPMDFSHPAKIAGTIAGFIVLLGIVLLSLARIRKINSVKNSTYFDWFFLAAIFLLVSTGLVIQWMRMMDYSYSYLFYFIHLVTVWMVLLYLPFSKFVHVLYRITALTFSIRTGRAPKA